MLAWVSFSSWSNTWYIRYSNAPIFLLLELFLIKKTNNYQSFFLESNRWSRWQKMFERMNEWKWDHLDSFHLSSAPYNRHATIHNTHKERQGLKKVLSCIVKPHSSIFFFFSTAGSDLMIPSDICSSLQRL